MIEAVITIIAFLLLRDVEWNGWPHSVPVTTLNGAGRASSLPVSAR